MVAFKKNRECREIHSKLECRETPSFFIIKILGGNMEEIWENIEGFEDIFMFKCGEKTLEGKEFFEILSFENNFEKEITKGLQELETEFNVFIKNNILFDKEKILRLIKLEKEYIFFLNNQRIKLGDELETIEEIEFIIEFCYKYMIENY